MKVTPLDCVYNLDIRDPEEFSKDYTRYLVRVVRNAITQNVTVTVEKRRYHEREFLRSFPYYTKSVRDWAEAINLAKHAIETLKENAEE